MEPVEEKRPKVIIFNNVQEIIRFGNSQIALDIGPKQLCAKFDDSTNNGHDLFLSFHRRFIAVENFLCVIDDNSGFKVAVVAPNKTLCQKLFTRIQLEKGQQQQSSNSAEDEAFFKEQIFIPILKEIQRGIPNFGELKTVILEFINSVESGIRKEAYFNLALEVSLSPIPTTNAIEMEQEDTLDDENLENSTMNDTSGSYSLRDRTYSINYAEVSNPSPTTNFIKRPNFEIVIARHNKKDRERLLVLDSKNKNLYYEYYFENLRKAFICYPCRKLGATVTAKLYKAENGNEADDYVDLGPKNHVCTMKKFKLDRNGEKIFEQLEIVMKPDFKIKRQNDREILVIFDSKNRNLCYKYSHFWKDRFRCIGCIKFRKFVTAKLVKDANGGDDYVRLGVNKHCCTMKEYANDNDDDESDQLQISMMPERSTLNAVNQQRSVSIFDENSKIIKKPNYQVARSSKFGHLVPKLVIFDPTNRNLCYEMYKEKDRKLFRCAPCHKLRSYISAKIIKNGEEEYLELAGNSHICDLKEYQPQEDFPANLMKNIFELPRDCRPRGRTVKRMAPQDAISSPEGMAIQNAISNPERSAFQNAIPNLEISAPQNITTPYPKRMAPQNKHIDLEEDLGVNEADIPARSIPASTSIRKTAAKYTKSPSRKGTQIVWSLIPERRTPQNATTSYSERMAPHNATPNSERMAPQNGIFNSERRTSQNATTTYPEKMEPQDASPNLDRPVTQNATPNPIRNALQNATAPNPERIAPQDASPNPERKTPRNATPYPGRMPSQNATPNPAKKKIVKKPNFEIVVRKNANGKINQRLVIYDPSNRDRFYEYFHDNTYFIYICSSCQSLKRRVTAILIQNGTDEEHVELGKNEHVCELKTKVEKEIIKKPDYKIVYRQRRDHQIVPRLVIFEISNRDLCREYYEDKSRNIFRCNPCEILGKYVTAKLIKLGNGDEEEECVELGNIQHCCDLKQYEPEQNLDPNSVTPQSETSTTALSFYR